MIPIKCTENAKNLIKSGVEMVNCEGLIANKYQSIYVNIY